MEDHLQAKETLKYLHIHHYHTQADVHHQELHGTLSTATLLKHNVVAQPVQLCLHNLATSEDGIDFD